MIRPTALSVNISGQLFGSVDENLSNLSKLDQDRVHDSLSQCCGFALISNRIRIKGFNDKKEENIMVANNNIFYQ